LLALGGLLTVRTNWSIYAQEFVLALKAAGCAATESQITGVPPMSAFEAKYQERGHRLYQVTSDLGLEHVVGDKLDQPAGLVFPEVGD
jgi:hypothetical protein